MSKRRRSHATPIPSYGRPSRCHGRAVSLAGGLLVAAIGLALIFDWLNLIVSLFPFTNPL